MGNASKPAIACRVSLGISSNFKTLILTILFVCTSSLCLADPWISPGDYRTRHHVQSLSSSGKLKLPVSTWPLMWSGISKALDTVRIESLTDEELWSYRYLKHELQKAKQAMSSGKRIYASSSYASLTNFGSHSREKTISSGWANITTDNLAFKVQGNLAESVDEDNYRFDGSFAALNLGNWVYGVGAIDRWWGPGWQNSLILSNNARPTPSIFLQRNESKSSSLPGLNLVGPWNVNFFLSELEKQRSVPNALLFGGRFNFRPTENLEIGLSRTIQWGGKGRTEDTGAFTEHLIGGGNSNQTDRTTANQLGGIDFRYTISFAGAQWSLYHEKVAGENENNHRLTEYIHTSGLSGSFATSKTHNRIVLEYTDTANDSLKSNTARGDTIYEDRETYRSGHRYRGRTIGATIDNDSKMISLNGFHEFNTGHHTSWLIAEIDFNMDNSNSLAPGGSPYGTELGRIIYTTLDYSLPLTKKIEGAFGVRYLNRKTRYNIKQIESSIHFSLNIHY